MNIKKTKFNGRPVSKSKQQGVALAIGIILLLIISVIGISSMKSAMLQEKMSGNLTKREYADTAAYSLLVSVENYIHTLYITNNGVDGDCPEECTVGPNSTARSDGYRAFTSEKNMLTGAIFPGVDHLGPLLPFIGDHPMYVLYDLASVVAEGADGSGAGYTVTVGETEDGSAGGSGGSGGGTAANQPEYEFFRIATKANDINKNFYVVYESIYAIVVN